MAHEHVRLRKSRPQPGNSWMGCPELDGMLVASCSCLEVYSMRVLSFFIVAGSGLAILCGGCGGGSGGLVGDVNLADAACGTAVNARAGNRIVVNLGSTYWGFQGSS